MRRDMTPEERAKDRASRAQYQRERRKYAMTLYFSSPAEMQAFQARGKAAGYANFNAYVLQLLNNATSGSIFPPEYVEGLKQEADRLRRWLETARDEADSYRNQTRVLQQQRDTLVVLLHGLPQGAEVAARFLQESVREARA